MNDNYYFNNKYYDTSIIVDRKTRRKNKDIIIELIIDRLEELLWEEELIR